MSLSHMSPFGRMRGLPSVGAVARYASVVAASAILATLSPVTYGGSTPELNPLLAHTAAGAVEGFQHGEGIVAFRGIPYAAPPVGALRWKAPQPPAAWEGVREAKAFGSDCMQFPYAPPVTSMSEDCLYLNLYKPASAKEGDHLPVYVWIYGGAFRANTASNPAGENTGDVRDGIIYVNFNYRVNVFGFMAHPGLTAETTYGASGNYGLMDEIAALQWVHDNIAKFGGDPANVTVSGASAGASSIGYLLVSPLNAGLFHRVLMQSTANWHPQRTLAQQEAWSVARFGSDISTLRAMPAKDLLVLTATPDGKGDGTDTLGDGHSGPFSYVDWLPIVDGHVLPVTDRKAWKEGDFKVVDMLIGDVENEGLLFMGFGPPIPLTKEAYDDYMVVQYGALGKEALIVYPASNDAEAAYQLGLATGDTLFSLPAREMARRMVKFTPNVYRYHFTKHTAKSPVTLHNAEQAYFFGNMAGNDAYNETDFALSTMLQQAKRRFIKTGDPNGGDLPHWTAYNADDPYMEFGDNGAVPGTGLRNQALDFAVKALDAKFPLN